MTLMVQIAKEAFTLDDERERLKKHLLQFMKKSEGCCRHAFPSIPTTGSHGL
jgi:hypothetical protein